MAKHRILQRAIEANAAHQTVLLAHFPATLAQVSEALEGVPGVAGGDWSSVHGHLAQPLPGRVGVGLARDLVGPVATAGSPGCDLVVLVAERHPLRRHDDAVVEAIESLSGARRVRFHLSLEDELLRPFANAQVLEMLKTLGLGEQDEISSSLVGRSIATAQKELEKRLVQDASAESVTDWMQQSLSA